MRTGWLVAMFLALFSLTAMAAGPGAVRKQVEASMLVTGDLEVSADGSVRTHAIDDAGKLPKGVVDFIQKSIDTWKFDPVLVDGEAVAIRNKMSLLVVAKKYDDDHYSIRLQATNFYPYKTQEGVEVGSRNMAPPRFPMAAAQNGVGGTVYLIVKVGRDGKVEDAVPEQVNLRIVATENQMGKWRMLLAKNSVQAAKAWEFVPPTAGEYVDNPYWLVRVPVDYRFPEEKSGYGQWQSYVPGPRQANPWAENEDAGYSPEALAAGGVHMMGKGGLRLLTPLGAES